MRKFQNHLQNCAYRTWYLEASDMEPGGTCSSMNTVSIPPSIVHTCLFSQTPHSFAFHNLKQWLRWVILHCIEPGRTCLSMNTVRLLMQVRSRIITSSTHLKVRMGKELLEISLDSLEPLPEWSTHNECWPGLFYSDSHSRFPKIHQSMWHHRLVSMWNTLSNAG